MIVPEQPSRFHFILPRFLQARKDEELLLGLLGFFGLLGLGGRVAERLLSVCLWFRSQEAYNRGFTQWYTLLRHFPGSPEISF